MLPRRYSIIIHEWGGEVVAVHEVFRKEGRCDPTRPNVPTRRAPNGRSQPVTAPSDPAGPSIRPTYFKSAYLRGSLLHTFTAYLYCIPVLHTFTACLYCMPLLQTYLTHCCISTPTRLLMRAYCTTTLHCTAQHRAVAMPTQPTSIASSCKLTRHMPLTDL